MIASELVLLREEAIALRLTDAYSIHRIVYDLFEDVRSDEEKKKSVPSGILFADKGIRDGKRLILILSNRSPKNPLRGALRSRSLPDSFLIHDRYIFEVTMNPSKREKKSGKTIAIRGYDAIRKWFLEKAPEAWGFRVNEETFRVEMMTTQRFWKSEDNRVTQSSATFMGNLQVIDRGKFAESIQRGIGRGRAFGFGFLQVVPIVK